jgi:cyclophilin family peptidyl-prolyl cis-trans isomerase/HEAT repeat protein
MRFGVRAIGALVLLAGAMAACAGRPVRPTAAPVPESAPAPARALTSLAEAEPALTALEDRRAFDAATLDDAAASPNAAVRALAALAFGRIGDARASASLGRLLGDASPDVRAGAAFAAGILGEQGLTRSLVPLLSDPEPAVAGRAAWAVGFLESSGGEAALAGAILGAATPELRAAFLRGLWRFASPAARDAALPYVADPDPAVRTEALYVLARRPQPASLAVLTAALEDPEAQTAALAARALGILGKPESIGPLAAAMGRARTPVTISAMQALAVVLEKNPAAAFPDDQNARVIALAGDVNPNLAVPALALLRWQTEDREAFRRLWAAASTGKQRRQQVALQSLMAGLGAKSLDLADTAIASPDPYLRGAAAEALSFLPAADAAPRRARLAADPEVVVRLRVLDGLRTPAEAKSSRALVGALLEDPNAGVRAAALDALALSEDPGILTVCLEMVTRSYGDRDPDVPISAIGAAEKTPESSDARAVVEAAYRHPSTLVSRLARRCLVKTFHADPAEFPWREYVTGKSVADYAALLAEARRPWTATIETVRGTFTVRFAGDAAPLTVMNFVALARKAYFDGAPIHRIVPNFVVQDGDPTGTGNGGPGYEIRDELNTIPYRTGSVGMALAGPDTGGSQWFVTQAPQPHLDGGYTVFGSVISGMDVVLRIEQGDRILRVTASAEAR